MRKVTQLPEAVSSHLQSPIKTALKTGELSFLLLLRETIFRSSRLREDGF